jgi:hypothetical protein
MLIYQKGGCYDQDIYNHDTGTTSWSKVVMEKDLGKESTMYGRRVASSESVISDLAERVFIRDLDPVVIRISCADQSQSGGSWTVAERIGPWPGPTDITESEDE